MTQIATLSPRRRTKSSTALLQVRRVWGVLLRYSRAMLADPALGSTNMFRHKKMVGEITHQVDQGSKQ